VVLEIHRRCTVVQLKGVESSWKELEGDAAAVALLGWLCYGCGCIGLLVVLAGLPVRAGPGAPVGGRLLYM
jgi:hypothetical protein